MNQGSRLARTVEKSMLDRGLPSDVDVVGQVLTEVVHEVLGGRRLR